ncbi:ribonuclease E inhibitor RraB [Phaeovulum sp. W22_SRMD_FR3]|jgi:regulator of RNase E activity RraB|uniref:ribonuclease E inhibitor RraB n=1 Tax=Phaeovulum sp. W22_SRMD_FR3 TaxID=3240274 RepID=UPI003F997509
MDLKGQKRETEEIFREIVAMQALPETACVNFQFVVEDEDANGAGFAAAAAALGYEAEWLEDEDEVAVTTASEPLSVEGLWAHEERLTRLAAEFGLEPDGWGFFAG